MPRALAKPHKLGNLCGRGHDHEGTGKSLRYDNKSGACVECARMKDREFKVKSGRAPSRQRSAPAPKPKALAVKTSAPTGNRVLGLLAQFCAGMKLAEFADKMGITVDRCIELVVRGLGEPEVPPTGGGGHAGGGPGGRTPPSGKSPAAIARGTSDERGTLLAPAVPTTASDLQRVYEALDLEDPTFVPVPPAELDQADDELDDEEREDDEDDEDEHLDEAAPRARSPMRIGGTTHNERYQAGARRSVTIAIHRLSKTELAIGALLWPERPRRPVTRSECAQAVRPCPFVSCKHHLYLDVDEDIGSIKLNYPELEPWELDDSCALDIADQGGCTLDRAGRLLNVTRERLRQIEIVALAKVKEHGGDDLLEALHDRPVTMSLGQLWEAAE